MQLVYDSLNSSLYKNTPPPKKGPSALQRSQVWTYLQQAFPADKPARILEVNCGTGEDALYLTRLGHKVLAADGSPNILEIATQKAERSKFPERPEFRNVGLGGIHADKFGEKFDLIFSNFGGLNKLDRSSLERFVHRLPRMLKPGGRVVAVIMPKNCLWENAYSVFSPDAKPRGTAGSAHASAIFYDPKEIKEIFSEYFEVVNQQPIGIALPPSRIEDQLNSRRRMLKRLTRIEKKLSQFSFLAGVSDHYLIDFKKM